MIHFSGRFNWKYCLHFVPKWFRGSSKKSNSAMSALFILINIFSTSQAFAKPNAEAKAEAYAKAKSAMSSELYLIYRVADRLITANDIDVPVKIIVQPGNSSEDEKCVEPNSTDSLLCASFGILPAVKTPTSFESWAAQSVTIDSANQSGLVVSDGNWNFTYRPAQSYSDKAYINQLACAMSYELARETLETHESERAILEEANQEAANKMQSAINNAHTAQRNKKLLMGGLSLVSGGILGGGLGGLATNLVTGGGSGEESEVPMLSQTFMSLALSKPNSISNQRIAQSALKTSSLINEALASLEGLKPNLVKRTWQDIDDYFREAALSVALHSEKQSYETDKLALIYMSKAGFAVNECVALWQAIPPYSRDSLITYLRQYKPRIPGSRVIDSVASVVPTSKLLKNVAEQKKNVESRMATATSAASDVLQKLSPRTVLLNTYVTAKQLEDFKKTGSSNIDSKSMRMWELQNDGTLLITNIDASPKKAGEINLPKDEVDVDKVIGLN